MIPGHVFSLRFRSWLVSVAIAAMFASGCSSGLHGKAYQRLADGGIGPPIPDVQLTFVKEDGAAVSSTSTDAGGHYQIQLPAARYYVLADHHDFQDYSTPPGFSVVTQNSVRTMNVFLREPLATTVLLVRHGEKLNPASTDPAEPLSDLGKARADALRDALFRAGVTAVYSTDTVRTRDTVEPLRAKLALTTQIYQTPAAVAASILADHCGDVVLVAAHSDTVSAVANALGGSAPAGSISDYDNLYAITRIGDAARVINLQYGADSAPDSSKNSGAQLTLLLARQVSGAAPVEAQRLLHTLQKAGVGAIHVNGGTDLVAPLAGALGLVPQHFTSATLDALLGGVLAAPPAAPLLVVGSPDDLRAAIQRLGADPMPVFYGEGRNDLVMVTVSPSGGARAVPLLY